MVIPPPKNAVTRPQSARDPTVRDRHIAQIRSNGRMAWQLATGYNQRSRIETQIGRWKGVIGPKLKSRSFSRQITEIQVGQKVLNTMTALGRPVFERIARRYRLGKGEFHLRPDPCNNAHADEMKGYIGWSEHMGEQHGRLNAHVEKLTKAYNELARLLDER